MACCLGMAGPPATCSGSICELVFPFCGMDMGASVEVNPLASGARAQGSQTAVEGTRMTGLSLYIWVSGGLPPPSRARQHHSWLDLQSTCFLSQAAIGGRRGLGQANVEASGLHFVTGALTAWLGAVSGGQVCLPQSWITGGLFCQEGSSQVTSQHVSPNLEGMHSLERMSKDKCLLRALFCAGFENGVPGLTTLPAIL